MSVGQAGADSVADLRPARPAALIALVALLVSGCGGGGDAPERLMDGSPALAPQVELEGGAGPAVAVVTRISTGADLEPASRAADCILGRYGGVHHSGPIVERVGVANETVTFRAASDVYGCDNSPGSREAGRRWCGSSTGRLYGGRLHDPRLDIGCTTDDGSQMGFAWVEPIFGARFVAVAQPGYSEVYEAAGGLPVRIATTTDVEIERSRASFHVSEHDAQGRLLRRYVLDAVVAG